MKYALLTLAAVAAASTPSASAAMAHTEDSLRAHVAKSDLVFVGTVTDVSYAPSLEQRNGQGIPHTFVTYEVEKVLQGTAEDKDVTLRFIGGRGEEASFLAVSDMPMFDKGDRDVLMVSANGTSGCPLVGCTAGRYRLINDLVFTEEGQAIESDGKSGIVRTAFYDLPEVMTHIVSQTTMYRVDQLEQGESRNKFEPGADRGAHMSSTQLIRQVETEARAVGRATPATFRSADISKPFSIRVEAEAAPADMVAKDHGAQRAATAQERAEIEAMASNGGNPVIENLDARQDGASQ
jgi:hypothetical protein